MSTASTPSSSSTSTATATATATSKTFKAAFVMPVSNVGLLLAEKKSLESCTFTCPDDPHPVSFKLRLDFGTRDGKSLDAFVMPMNRAVRHKWLNFVIFDDKTKYLMSRGGPAPRGLELSKKFGRGYNDLYLVEGVGNVDWKILCEIAYHGVKETGPTDSSKSHCECKCTKCKDGQNHLQTMSKNMLDLFSDPRNPDITLVVGECRKGKKKEKIAAHKDILSARSSYFRSLFDPSSDWKESSADEIKLDVTPAVFKELLRFLYSGLPPENLNEIAMELLPVADKYAVDELKALCDSAIRQTLTADNVVQVLHLAENHYCPDLFEFCVPLFKANINTLDKPQLGSLTADPKLLLKLLKVCSE